MNDLAIIHFQPIEGYPPVLNLLNYLAEKDGDFKVRIFTMFPATGKKIFQSSSSKITIYRKGSILRRDGAIKRYRNYLLFYSAVIYNCLKQRPGLFLVFETLSVFPAYVCKRIFGQKAGLMIHYHEYTSLKEYQSGMKLVKWFHTLERKLFPAAAWISQTNKHRLDQFLSDHSDINITSGHVLPNFPPLTFKRRNLAAKPGMVKVVYVGALSLETMYVKAFSEWVMSQKGKVSWDIFSSNTDEHVMDYLKLFDSTLINFKGAVDYTELPDLLSTYHVGVILYNGHIPNYVYNAPNKLFEYLAVGLDVWIPDVMVSSLEYKTTDSYPKVIPLDFNRLDKYTSEFLYSREALHEKESNFYCETVLPGILNNINGFFNKQKYAD